MTAPALAPHMIHSGSLLIVGMLFVIPFSIPLAGLSAFLPHHHAVW